MLDALELATVTERETCCDGGVERDDAAGDFVQACAQEVLSIVIPAPAIKNIVVSIVPPLDELGESQTQPIEITAASHCPSSHHRQSQTRSIAVWNGTPCTCRSHRHRSLRHSGWPALWGSHTSQCIGVCPASSSPSPCTQRTELLRAREDAAEMAIELQLLLDRTDQADRSAQQLLLVACALRPPIVGP
jgi:hypothetical protein